MTRPDPQPPQRTRPLDWRGVCVDIMLFGGLFAGGVFAIYTPFSEGDRAMLDIGFIWSWLIP